MDIFVEFTKNKASYLLNSQKKLMTLKLFLHKNKMDEIR